jgi:hypothetical protein
LRLCVSSRHIGRCDVAAFVAAEDARAGDGVERVASSKDKQKYVSGVESLLVREAKPSDSRSWKMTRVKGVAPEAARRWAHTGRTPSRLPYGQRKPLFICDAPGRLPMPRSATASVSRSVRT